MTIRRVAQYLVCVNRYLDWGRRHVPDLAIVALTVGTILELALPFVDLGIQPEGSLAFFVAVSREGQEIERHPAQRPIALTAPDALFQARNWQT